MTNFYSLSQLGWQAFFQQQLTLEEWEHDTIARVITQQRAEIQILTTAGSQSLPIVANMPPLVVGDWVLIDGAGRFKRTLERLSQFSRKAVGSGVAVQHIAVNVDTAFIVCSLNRDFNLNRIERYLALTNEAGVEPLVVLTKADCCTDPESYIQQVQALDQLLMVLAVNSLDPGSVSSLAPWCRAGKTVALLGSSGVGKSTLVNTLTGQTLQTTGAIREDDSKGRHTTTGRSLHLMPTGGLLLDTPGMRELQLADCAEGIEGTFTDISELAERCQFSDCQHQSEPGCAVQTAIEEGQLDSRRLRNYRKLMREQALNSASLAEKRDRERNRDRYYRTVQRASRQRKKT